MSEIKGCMNCGNISCENNKQRRVDGCGRWKSPEQKIIELEGDRSKREKAIIELSREFNRRIVNYEKRIAEFKKENAELKEKLEVVIALKDEEIGCIQTDFNTFKSKSKELLERLLITSCNSDVLNLLPNCSEVLRARVEAEQFLEEVEK